MKKIFNILVPNMFFKEPILEITDKELLQTIEELKQANSIESAMQMALGALAKKYNSKRFSTYTLFFRIFERDPNVLWRRKGFMHCNQQNYLFRLLLVKSGKARDNQVKLGYSFVWYVSPHQYLKVRVGEKWVAVDPWNYGRGAALGKYATGFGMRSLEKIK